ncbi:MAG: flagellar assembly protein T N-terminal domain-containing protein [Nitrospira sp.]|nr:flagellar assembly protein T N-terminal domain-containing protein [Nitrospira sp.]
MMGTNLIAWGILWGLVAVVLCARLATAAEHDPKVVVAQGVATVLSDKADTARDVALQDALRQAVEQAVGTVVESNTLVQNFQLVESNIYTKTKGYVQRYTLLNERQEGPLYKVSVQAIVDMGSLERDLDALGLLYQRMKKPRVMVVILEIQRGIRSVEAAAETEMIRKLVQSGFMVVDQEQIQTIRASDQINKLVGGDLKTAQLLGRQHGAEVLIVGKGVSEGAIRGGPLANFVSVRARVEARAIRTDTGDILAAEGVSAPGLDLSEQVAGKNALAAAGEKWVEAALPAILDRWSKEANGGNSVQVVVSGLTFAQLGKFKERLKTEVRGVKDIHQRSFTANVAMLDVDVKGSAQELADDIVRKNFPSFKIEVVGFSPNRLDLSVVSQ